MSNGASSDRSRIVRPDGAARPASFGLLAAPQRRHDSPFPHVQTVNALAAADCEALASSFRPAECEMPRRRWSITASTGSFRPPPVLTRARRFRGNASWWNTPVPTSGDGSSPRSVGAEMRERYAGTLSTCRRSGGCVAARSVCLADVGRVAELQADSAAAAGAGTFFFVFAAGSASSSRRARASRLPRPRSCAIAATWAGRGTVFLLSQL